MIPDVVLAVSVGLTGMLAGLYLGFAVAVMPALRAADDRTFVDAMRRINRSIQNAVFFLLFAGSPVAAVVAAALDPVDAWRWIAAALAVVAFVGTLAVNVPLNTRLDDATGDAAARSAFERPWNRAHGIRTGALVLSVTAGLIALAG